MDILPDDIIVVIANVRTRNIYIVNMECVCKKWKSLVRNNVTHLNTIRRAATVTVEALLLRPRVVRTDVMINVGDDGLELLKNREFKSLKILVHRVPDFDLLSNIVRNASSFLMMRGDGNGIIIMYCNGELQYNIAGDTRDFAFNIFGSKTDTLYLRMPISSIWLMFVT